MTGVGITLYLVVAMHNYILAALSAGLFAPLIGFHFVISLISKRDDLVTIEGVLRRSEKSDIEKAMQRS